MAKEYILESHYNSPQEKSPKLENRKPVKIVFPSDMTPLKEDYVREGYQKSSHGKDHRDAKRTFPKFG